jgi:hypothetical protein
MSPNCYRLAVPSPVLDSVADEACTHGLKVRRSLGLRAADEVGAVELALGVEIGTDVVREVGQQTIRGRVPGYDRRFGANDLEVRRDRRSTSGLCTHCPRDRDRSPRVRKRGLVSNGIRPMSETRPTSGSPDVWCGAVRCSAHPSEVLAIRRARSDHKK